MLIFHTAYQHILDMPELVSAKARPEDFFIFVMFASTQSNYLCMNWFRGHSSGAIICVKEVKFDGMIKIHTVFSCI